MASLASAVAMAMRVPRSCPRAAFGDRRSSLLVALSLTAASKTRQGIERLFADSIKQLDSSLARVSQARNMEEALMTVPDLETIPYRVISRHYGYEIRQVESYLVAETSMPGKKGFEFFGSSQAFNTIATYIFGKNTKQQEMAMTTPVLVKNESIKLEMTTPVVSTQEAEDEWKMAFVMPSSYTEETLPTPEDSSVTIRRVPAALMAVTSFSGLVSDEEVRKREEKMRQSIKLDGKVRVKPGARVEVAQYNPPFTPPMFRRNEVALEVEEIQD
ncbi:heme-binding-like protein At3g10130, chloroplastic [Selaginella moellendorffii]|uniref:heme-binding-like protein At3g10130, chloroplastic n=1 Tax=Selaginella moellendorffii TaxID=88036 RepID=UPI000D1CCBD4|nr:heme-binding-like protein At3g10130, chloroplastic [Selaginella moellendorffii]XP_024516864.1 heme-binding-like protein At3g10130, chloroplastic [Selaginella moellendorffii]XP_024516865.1 heme-binding-like protein At3g10130, chloroplastic [Selaginella moellendorffii]XP_024516866.1 heme-binding-like protein At3g10130, chloroplastic [Selaginella moellendorffii]XP_024537052.1 heme-binding-like protein At3g10130, chloroplastic [Selaginella moellendorffii]XP_024537053.1 heme-binding-like protein|eukprot:XP_024516862.1 heme-binding-like protein At3g10130, chloroplastic [Selaginella moellendorffii]